MTRIYFVRHAQPDFKWFENSTRPLTEEGMKDTEKVLEFFVNLKDKDGIEIDEFYASTFIRSSDTIRSTANYFKKHITLTAKLSERKAGPNGNSSNEMFYKRWADFDFCEEGGESLRSVQDRNMEAVNDILKKHEGKNIVIGTHGTSLSTILNYYDNSFGCDDFLRIIDWMPFIIELDFEGDKLVGKKEHMHIEKIFSV